MPIPALYGTILSTLALDLTNFCFVPSMAAFANAAMVLFAISPRKLTIVALLGSGDPLCLIGCEYILGQNQPTYEPCIPSIAGV
jgi:hypothetical protein